MIREEVRAVLMHTAFDVTLRWSPGFVLVGGEIGERRVRLSKREWGKWARWMMNVKRDLQSAVNDRAIFQTFSDVVRQNGEWIDAHSGSANGLACERSAWAC